MAAIRAERRGPDRSSVRRIVAVAAVVVLLVAGGAVGAVLSSTRHPAPATTAVESSSLHSTVGARGTVLLVSSSHRDWLVVDVRDAPTSGRVSCTLTLADGTRLWVGAFPLARGHGSWTTWLSVPARSVRAVDMTDQGGTTVASARLR
jgi:hypothetical protein